MSKSRGKGKGKGPSKQQKSTVPQGPILDAPTPNLEPVEITETIQRKIIQLIVRVKADFEKLKLASAADLQHASKAQADEFRINLNKVRDNDKTQLFLYQEKYRPMKRFSTGYFIIASPEEITDEFNKIINASVACRTGNCREHALIAWKLLSERLTTPEFEELAGHLTIKVVHLRNLSHQLIELSYGNYRLIYEPDSGKCFKNIDDFNLYLINSFLGASLDSATKAHRLAMFTFHVGANPTPYFNYYKIEYEENHSYDIARETIIVTREHLYNLYQNKTLGSYAELAIPTCPVDKENYLFQQIAQMPERPSIKASNNCTLFGAVAVGAAAVIGAAAYVLSNS